MKKGIRICYVDNRLNNLKAAVRLEDKLRREKNIEEILLNSFTSTREMCQYIKSENSISVKGVLPFFDDIKYIIPAGLNVVDNLNLYISSALIVNLGKGSVKKRIPSRQEFLIISNTATEKFSSRLEGDYVTIGVIKEIKKADIKEVDNLLVIEQGLISYYLKFEARTSMLYLKINSHFSKVKTEIFKDKGFLLKILGTYKIPQENK